MSLGDWMRRCRYRKSIAEGRPDHRHGKVFGHFHRRALDVVRGQRGRSGFRLSDIRSALVAVHKDQDLCHLT